MKEETMLFRLLDQINARISGLDDKKEAPHMLLQINKARPDFKRTLFQNAPQKPKKEVADLVFLAIAQGALSQIKQIPEITGHMISGLKNRSLDPSIRCVMAASLVYLVQPHDFIPDDAPGGYGFIDDNAIIRAGMIEYLKLVPNSADAIKAQQDIVQFTARLVPLQLVPTLQLTIDGMSTNVQMLRVLPEEVIELTIQQMINAPLQMPVISQPAGFTPSPGPSLGNGHWAGGAYFEGNNVVISGGPSLIDGQLFIPD
jgi:uncharacterized membrane protein YkvA (DUF1232 family)